MTVDETQFIINTITIWTREKYVEKWMGTIGLANGHILFCMSTRIHCWFLLFGQAFTLRLTFGHTEMTKNENTNCPHNYCYSIWMQKRICRIMKMGEKINKNVPIFFVFRVERERERESEEMCDRRKRMKKIRIAMINDRRILCIFSKVLNLERLTTPNASTECSLCECVAPTFVFSIFLHASRILFQWQM